jgi:predicted secreted hydrolase
MAFGDDEDQYFTWLCSVPRGKVGGTLTVDGKTAPISGFGYHDHQWGNVHTAMIWNHWIWIRQSVGDYNILVFDLVANRELGFKRYPLVFIQDKEGRTVFENTENVQCEVMEEYLQEKTQKTHPKSFKYTFQDGEKKVEYTVAMDSGEVNKS